MMQDRISVIVPGFNSASTIERSIRGLLGSLGQSDELIYVDDGSTDDTVQRVEAFGDQRLVVVRSVDNIGRGPIRNLGARAARGDVLVFVDSDVVVNPSTIDSIRREFSDPEMDALFGSYDDHPDVRGRVGAYRNLLHHFTHHSSGDTASHFWTGLGAIRRELFWEIGGFNEDLWSRNMEEVEFGHRLTRSGRVIRVLPEIQATHLKDYSVWSMFRTDLFSRAIPWTRLLLSDRQIDRFVLSNTQRLSAIGAALLFASIFAAFVSTHWALGLALSGVLLFLAANWRLGRFLIERRGVAFGMMTAPLHLLHSWAAIAGFVIGSLQHIVKGLRTAVGGKDLREIG